MEGRCRLCRNGAADSDGDGNLHGIRRDARSAGAAEGVAAAVARWVCVCGLGGELFRAAHSLARAAVSRSRQEAGPGGAGEFAVEPRWGDVGWAVDEEALAR